MRSIKPEICAIPAPRPAEPYTEADYEVERIPRPELAQIIASSLGDRQLFEANLGMYRFLVREQYHELGLDEDPVFLFDCLASDIARRRAEIDATPLSMDDHMLLLCPEAPELARVA